jgi:poly(hydroxyalkanoate) depolymerase family esterase
MDIKGLTFESVVLSSGRRIVAAALMAFPLAAAAMGWLAPSGPSQEISGFGTNPGNLQMFKYVPANLGASRPLVVALHGCLQGASDYDDETGWTALADQWGFALLLPQQQLANNPLKCFNWFEPQDYAREGGEAMSIKQMVDKMRTDHQIDPARIYVTGLSAGGGMTAVMLATYPDVFAGGAIMAGVPYRCAANSSETSACGVNSQQVKDLTPSQWGDLVRNSPRGNGTNNAHPGPWPRVSIWQGGADKTVQPLNQRELLEQWTDVHGIDLTPDTEESVRSYPHRLYKNAAGKVQVETYFIPQMAHGTPIDPGTGPGQCGKSASFILDVDICSSFYVGKFFGLDQGP